MTLTNERTITEEEALVSLVKSCDATACPLHEVGPLAHHLAGPLQARRPEGHPRQNAPHGASVRAVDNLIDQATHGATICTCGLSAAHPLLVSALALAGRGHFARPHGNTPEDQTDFELAIHSGDIDVVIYHLDPRLDALKMLADRARATAGGQLDWSQNLAIRTLATTLVGLARWDSLSGFRDGCPWSNATAWSIGYTAQRAASFTVDPGLALRADQRLIEGV